MRCDNALRSKLLGAPYGTIDQDKIAMTIEDVRLLYEYDRWANNRILTLVGAITPEQFTRDLGSFTSVRDVLLHIIASKWAWLAYWKESSPSDQILTDLFMRAATLFQSETFPTLATVQAKWAEVEKEQVEFVNEVTDELLDRTLPVRNTSISLAHLMQHLANHSTYHRGQIAMMLRQLGATAQGTDFAEFLLTAADSDSHRAALYARLRG
jgi:uncharacterized damage-inducible protein DinB